MAKRVVVTTREVAPQEGLLSFASPQDPWVWLRGSNALVVAENQFLTTLREDRGTLATEGEHPLLRSDRLAKRWQEFVATAEIDDPVSLPGTGLVALGALSFAEHSPASSVLQVPRTLFGQRDGRAWITQAHFADESPAPLPEAHPFGPMWSAQLGPGSQSAQGYLDSVAAALGKISAGEVDKIVLARDLRGQFPAQSDLRWLIRSLHSSYPDTWVFSADGLIGASPETLITVNQGSVTARVLAGTSGRGASPDQDILAATALAQSRKDLDEHRYAVLSLTGALQGRVRALAAADAPFILTLPNVFHLATDVEAELTDNTSVLDLIGAIHPTAAVAGTPTAAAMGIIAELEPFDRGRFAGPVGWVDASGNGEWAIALRCAQVSPLPEPSLHAVRNMTAFAGAGIVIDSDPGTELLETRVKFRPIIDALA